MKHLLKYFGALLLVATFSLPAFSAEEDIIALSPNRDQVVEKLMAQLSDCDNTAQIHAAFALGEGRIDGAVEPLIGMLDSGTEKCKVVAALALSRIGTDRAASAVRWAARKDDNARVRTLAAWYYEQYVHPGSFEFVSDSSPSSNPKVAAR